MRSQGTYGSSVTRRGWLAVLAAAMSGCTGRQPSAEAPARMPDFKDAVPAIDTHVHLFRPMPKEWVKSEGPDAERFLAAPVERRAEEIREQMRRSNTKALLAMGQIDGADDDPMGVRPSIECGSLAPGTKVVGVIDPRKAGRPHLLAVERQLNELRQHIVAFKSYLGYLHFGPAHPAYLPYYRLAEKYRLPVIFHTGDTWMTGARLEYAHPLRIDEVAVAHPGVRFALAHFGNPWLLDAAEVAYKNENVWVDLSAFLVASEEVISKALASHARSREVPGVTMNALRDAVNYLSPFDKVMYGSDFPLAPLPAYRWFVETIIPAEYHAKVFRDNAAKLFGIAGL